MYKLENITCEHLMNPLAVTAERPRFCWELVSEKSGIYQNTYRIVVQKEDGGIVWDSNRTEGSRSVDVEYEGKILESACRYCYQITVWTSDGAKVQSTEQYFETAFLMWQTGRHTGLNRIRFRSLRKIHWKAHPESGWRLLVP